jgi:glycerol kinase
LSTATTRQELQQSVLEGIAFQAQEVIAAMESVIPLSDSLSVDGGLTASRYFLQFLADATDKRITRNASIEVTAYGCALLAGLEADRFSVAVSEPPHRYERAVSTEQRLNMLERYRAAANACVSLS